MKQFSSLPWWSAAMENLNALIDLHGHAAAARARDFAEVYQGRRGAMVVDVIASRQRKYEQRVLGMVAAYETSHPSSLAHLAREGWKDIPGLRQGEAETMRSVAQGLLGYSQEHSFDEDFGVKVWAEGAESFVHAPKIEPYVGHLHGVGPALFAYLRIRSGADGIKPDSRVHAALVRLGFPIPSDEHAIYVVAQAAATQAGIPLLELDQLLWWTEPDAANGSDRR